MAVLWLEPLRDLTSGECVSSVEETQFINGNAKLSRQRALMSPGWQGDTSLPITEGPLAYAYALSQRCNGEQSGLARVDGDAVGQAVESSCSFLSQLTQPIRHASKNSRQFPFDNAGHLPVFRVRPAGTLVRSGGRARTKVGCSRPHGAVAALA